MRKLRVRLLFGMLAVMAFAAAESVLTPVQVSAGDKYDEVCCSSSSSGCGGEQQYCRVAGIYKCCISTF